MRHLRPDVPALIDQPPTVAPAPGRPSIVQSRRRLALDAFGMLVSAGAFGIVYGLAANQAGFSIVEALAASVFVLAGASQFAAVGLVAQGVPWVAIVPLTALLNARHLLYSAALVPWARDRSRLERAAMAHVLTDETFALSLPHFSRIGRFDPRGYWIAAGFVVLPWIAATVIGYYAGAVIPNPYTLGLDVVFPAAMGGLAVGLITGRRELLAAVVAAVAAVGVALASDAAIGIVAGGILGPLVALLVPERVLRRASESHGVNVAGAP